MYPSAYDYGFDSSASDLENFFTMMESESSSSPVTLIFNILSYVLLAIGLYTIAKRRGIRHAWLAWIPIGNTWLLGCISDQYRYIVRHEEKSKRKVMLVLEILTAVACVVMIVLLVMMFLELLPFVSSVTTTDIEAVINNGADSARLMQSAGWVAIAGVVTMGLGIALMVLMFMAYHDLFASCDPNNKTVFLVLGILFSTLMSIFVFVCRKKDHGMPPRRDEMPPQPEMWTPPQAATQTSYQPPVEPWDQNNEL